MPPRTRTAAQAQDEERHRDLQDIIELLHPSIIRSPQIPPPLDDIQSKLYQQIVSFMAQATARNELMFEKIRGLFPLELQLLATHRENIRASFREFENKCYETQDEIIMSQAMHEIAGKLREEVIEIQGFDPHRTAMQATFMIGSLIMVLNEVAKMGQNTHPWRRRMYGLLMNRTSDVQPCLEFPCIDAWSEGEWGEYALEVQVLRIRFRSLKPPLLAPENVVKELDRVLPKILPTDVNERSNLELRADDAAASEIVDDRGDDEKSDEEENRGESN